ncbi:MAG: VTT domain-containing protein [Bryobacteraceae bacterium]
MKHLAEVLLQFGPVGVFLLAILESSGLPLAATDVSVTLLAWKTPEHAYLAAALAVAGSLIGNIGLFSAARFGGSRWIKAPKPEAPQRFRQWFQRYGLITVFVPAMVPLIPLPLKVFVISAGVLRSARARFVAVVVAARAIRYFGLAWLGLSLGGDAPGFLKRNAWAFTGAAAALILVLFVLVWLADRRGDGADVTMS